ARDLERVDVDGFPVGEPEGGERDVDAIALMERTRLLHCDAVQLRARGSEAADAKRAVLEPHLRVHARYFAVTQDDCVVRSTPYRGLVLQPIGLAPMLIDQPCGRDAGHSIRHRE